MNITKIKEVLTELNDNYGRGEVVEVNPPVNGIGTFIRQIPITNNSTFNETRKYQVNKGTIKALRHQRTIKSRS
jgi:hypothetical protein